MTAMKKAYTVLSILMVIVAISLLLLPQRVQNKQLSPRLLLHEINDPSRFLSTDQVAQMIISGDPSLFLIDTRDSSQYDKYHLPGAYNIPAEAIANPEYKDVLYQFGKNIVFYSNGDILSEDAWVIAKRMGKMNIYVMKDGLNSWMETIINPQAPAETASSYDIDLYEFRKGAKIYFGGGSAPEAKKSNAVEPIIVTRKVKQAKTEGGC